MSPLHHGRPDHPAAPGNGDCGSKGSLTTPQRMIFPIAFMARRVWPRIPIRVEHRPVNGACAAARAAQRVLCRKGEQAMGNNRKVTLTAELTAELDALGAMYQRWCRLDGGTDDDLVYQSSGSPLDHLAKCLDSLLAESAPADEPDAVQFADDTMVTFSDNYPDFTLCQARQAAAKENARIRKAEAEQAAADAAEDAAWEAEQASNRRLLNPGGWRSV